jgi:hypothetical protein
MATEHIREKINLLNNAITSEALQIYQHECLVEAASQSTGDKQVDEQIKTQAQNSKSVILGSERRLAVYRARHAALQAELEKAKPDA